MSPQGDSSPARPRFHTMRGRTTSPSTSTDCRPSAWISATTARAFGSSLPVVDRDVGTGLRQLEGAATPDTPRRPGHQCLFTQ